MDDISEKLSSLLSDPSGMEKIKDMAQSLLGSGTQSGASDNAADSEPDIGSIMRVMKLIRQNGNEDSRIKLLLALKPNLSPEKQARVDSAIKMLKLAEIAPLLKDSGILDF